MLTVNCPNCGAALSFRSSALPARVCDYCRTMVVRSGDTIEPVGTVAELPFDVSPIQIGMRGRFEDKAFEVVGRIRWGWTDGSWNEWLLLFDDGSDAWLGEAMGQFMLLKERPAGGARVGVVRAIASGTEVEIGTEAQVEGTNLIVSDARRAKLLAAEGELRFTPKAGWTVYSVDLKSRGGRCVSIQRDSEGTHVYDGRYVTLAELEPQGLRPLDGWKLPAYGR